MGGAPEGNEIRYRDVKGRFESLRQPCDAPRKIATSMVTQRHTIEGHRAPRRFHQTGQQLKKRRLAGPVRTDDSHELTRFNRQRDAAQRLRA